MTDSAFFTEPLESRDPEIFAAIRVWDGSADGATDPAELWGRRIGRALSQREDEYLLGHVPHMYSMPATAQDVHAPIAELAYGDGIKGSQGTQRDNYAGQIKAVSDAVHDRLFGSAAG